MIAVEVVTGV